MGELPTNKWYLVNYLAAIMNVVGKKHQQKETVMKRSYQLIKETGYHHHLPG